MPSSEYRKSFQEDSRMIALASNSKSAQSFMFSEDGKYMLKTASESELDSMLRLLPHYAEHVSRRRGSLITRFFGVYRVTNPRTKRSTIFVSSSNVFSTEKRLHERYDLKGSVVGRRTIPRNSSAFKPTTMLKDLDLADRDKIRLAAGYKKRLMRELSADAEFLAGLGVMDYSLLVGIHRPLRPKSSRLLALPLSVLAAASKPVWAAGCFALGFLPGGARRGGRRPPVGVYPGREPGVVYYVGIIDVLQRPPRASAGTFKRALTTAAPLGPILLCLDGLHCPLLDFSPTLVQLFLHFFIQRGGYCPRVGRQVRRLLCCKLHRRKMVPFTKRTTIAIAIARVP
ncbi:unnamed protein product [Ectocarpus sp. 12 AP-2014]